MMEGMEDAREIGRCTWTCNDDGTHTVTAFLDCGCEYIDEACIPCLQHTTVTR